MCDMVPKTQLWRGVTVYCCGDVKTSGGVDDLSLDDPPCRGPGASEKNCWVGLYIFGLPIARKVAGPGTRHRADKPETRRIDLMTKQTKQKQKELMSAHKNVAVHNLIYF